MQVRFSGNGEIDLGNVYSNPKEYAVKETKPGSCDWLYVLRGGGQVFLIKKCLGGGRRSIKPTGKDLL